MVVTEQALKNFRRQQQFLIGVDNQVLMITPGSVDRLASDEIEDEVVGFAFTDQGLMPDPSLEGSKINRLAR